MNPLPASGALGLALALAAGTAAADSSGRWQSSREAYDKVCAYCHEARVGPVLTGRQLAPVYIRTMVRSGNRAMPAFRESEISDEVLDGIAKLVAESTPAAPR